MRRSRQAPLFLQSAIISSVLWSCSSTPPPPQMRPIHEQAPLSAMTAVESEEDQACLEATRNFYKRAWRSIDDYLEEIKPLLRYLSALDTDQVGQRLHRAHYLAEFQEQVFQRFRLMERVTDRCELARPGLLRYRDELILKLSQLM